MANEIQVTVRENYAFVYIIIYDAQDTAQAYNPNSETFDTITNANWKNHNILLTRDPSNTQYRYIGSIPSIVPRKLLNVTVYGTNIADIMAGPGAADAQPGDMPLATGVLAWDGTQLVFPATFEQITDVQTEITALQASIAALQTLVEEKVAPYTIPIPGVDDCDGGLPFGSLYEAIFNAKEIEVAGQRVVERSADDLIKMDRHLQAKRNACKSKGNGWGSIGVARAIPPDASGAN